MEERKIEVSVVIPVWNDEVIIAECYRQLIPVLRGMGCSYEIIFVDDGSKDGTFELLKSLHQKDNKVKIVRLVRNFGQWKALLAGFGQAEGEILVGMDTDLQNDPRDIPKLVSKVKEGFDFVSGWRVNRKDSLIKRRIPSLVLNKLISLKTGIRLHDFGCSLNAGRKELGNKLFIYGETSRFIKPLLAYLADSLAEVKVRHYPRKIGKSKYSLFRLIKMSLDIIIRLSLKPKPSSKPLFVIKEVIK